jgi:hypothetical protein
MEGLLESDVLGLVDWLLEDGLGLLDDLNMVDFLDFGLDEELVFLIVHFIDYNQRTQRKLGKNPTRDYFC